MSVYWIPRHHIENACALEANAITGRVLDFGCGSMPYARIFKNATEYVGVEYDKGLKDGETYFRNGIIYFDGRTLPFSDGCFDAIVSFQVLEHVIDLGLIMQELNRVIRPGGTFFFTVPLLWPEHETPSDYRRFTRWGTEKMLLKEGFDPVKIYPLGTIYDVVLVFFLDYFNTFENQLLQSFVRRFSPVVNLVSRILNAVDPRARRVDRYCYLDLCALARKPPLGDA